MILLLVERHDWTPPQVSAMTLPQVRKCVLNIIGDEPTPTTVKIPQDKIEEWREKQRQRAAV